MSAKNSYLGFGVFRHKSGPTDFLKSGPIPDGLALPLSDPRTPYKWVPFFEQSLQPHVNDCCLGRQSRGTQTHEAWQETFLSIVYLIGMRCVAP